MVSPEMEFHCGTKTVTMYVDDDGMYRITQTYTDKNEVTHLASLAEKVHANTVFNRIVYRIMQDWENEL